MRKKLGSFQIVLIVLIALTAVFIWSNSCKVSSDTMNESDSVKEFFIWLFSNLGIDISASFFIDQIRKFGHFAEFALLGCELMLYGVLYLKRKLVNVLNMFYIGSAVALIDETIQLIPWLGRSSEVRDVWIDVSGVVTGIAIVLLISLVVRSIKRKKAG